MVASVAVVHATGDVKTKLTNSLAASIEAEVSAKKLDASAAAAYKSNLNREVARTVDYGGFVVAYGYLGPSLVPGS
jgi:hypothetical protein